MIQVVGSAREAGFNQQCCLQAILCAHASKDIGLFDVFDVEPLPRDHPFLALDNLILTPHIGYVSRESYTVFYRHVLEDIQAFLDGNPVRVVQPVAH